MTVHAHEIHLARRPRGVPEAEDYRFVTRALPDPGPGEILVRNLALSVDPYMRPRMNDTPSYVPPFELDRPMLGGAVGRVVESRDPGLPEGSLVVHDLGWRDHAVLPAAAASLVSPGSHPPSYHLGVLGMPGLTAYVGLFHIARLQAGESVFVSAAAGAVGGLVGQFARLAGASRVVGSAGSAEKVEHVVRDLGFDAAFDYKDGRITRQLAEAFPDGFEVYFDNVGGDHLAAALEVINDFGRMAMCGTVSIYNATEVPLIPGRLFRVTPKRLRLEGFIVTDHEDLRSEFEERVGGWLDEGALFYTEHVTQGLEQMPAAFEGMLAGENVGKAIVSLE